MCKLVLMIKNCFKIKNYLRELSNYNLEKYFSVFIKNVKMFFWVVVIYFF